MLELLNKYKDYIVKGLLSIVIIICFIGVVSTLFEKCSGPKDKTLTVKIDSLNRINDLLSKKIIENNRNIYVMTVKDSILKKEVNRLKSSVQVIHDTVYKKISIIKK
jgi:hypothetical protein